MIPRSASRARTASAQPAGVVYDNSNFPCSSPFSIPQISGTVLRYWTTETLGRGIGQQSRANSFYRKTRACQLGLPIGVTSSCLCKKPEGAVFPFGLLVHSVEDGIDNPIHAADIDEANHGPRAASHFHETPLDDIGGAELAPKVTREVEEGEQLGQILLQALHHPRIGLF